MSHTLKLHIWKILLKPTYVEGNKLPKNKELLKRIHDQESDVSLDPYNAFVKQYIQSFNGEFAKDAKKNKSFAPVADSIKIYSSSQLICGFFEGGVTGIKQKIKPNNNFRKPPRYVNDDEMVGLDYFFYLWIPKDVNYAYIMIQSYSEVNRGIAGAFFEHFQSFLSKYTYGFRNREIKVPKPIKDLFINESMIIGLECIKDKTSPNLRNRFNPSLHDSERMKIRFSVSGLKIPFLQFKNHFKGDNKGNPFFIDMAEIGMVDPNDYITVVKYHDPTTGRDTNAQLTDLLNIRPTIVIPDDVKMKGSEFPDFEKISKFCAKQLKLLQLEDKYATIDEFED